jgi:hypothetical protein
MSRLTMAQAYAYARKAGFDPAAAVIAAAIAMGESGLNTEAKGDTSLTTDYWGPSVGLMQIRTVKSQTGTGKDRDIGQLTDPLQNMIAAYNISSHGKNWTPWTVYNTGKYRQFLGQAQQGAAAGGTAASTGGNIESVGWLGDALGVDDALARAKQLGFVLLAIAAGGTLVVLGGYRLAGSPKPPAAALALL